ncbi:MAG: hypothetical protein WC829_22215 [Hyphomicrobium sp.]
MTDKFVASKYVGRFAVVRNPDLGTEWIGRIVGYHEMPSVTLEREDGFRLSLPAAWVRPADELKPWHEAQEGEVWLIRPSRALEVGEVREYPAIFQAGCFRDHGGSWSIEAIVSARRIWPVSDA